jgi:hypothetical protein
MAQLSAQRSSVFGIGKSKQQTVYQFSATTAYPILGVTPSTTKGPINQKSMVAITVESIDQASPEETTAKTRWVLQLDYLQTLRFFKFHASRTSL